jgi:hypothetical protein
MTRNFVRAAVSASLVLAGAFGVAGAASAAPPAVSTSAGVAAASASTEDLTAETRVLGTVVTAADHKAAYQGLSAADKSLFTLALTHQTAVQTKSATIEVAPSASLANKANLSGGAVVAAATRCWSYPLDITWYDLGFADGETWNTLNWCSVSNVISSYSMSNVGGRGLGGQTYDGVVATWFNNVGWEVRGVSEYNFDYFGSHAYPCNQIRGGATGLVSTPGATGGHGGNCNVY